MADSPAAGPSPRRSSPRRAGTQKQTEQHAHTSSSPSRSTRSSPSSVHHHLSLAESSAEDEDCGEDEDEELDLSFKKEVRKRKIEVGEEEEGGHTTSAKKHDDDVIIDPKASIRPPDLTKAVYVMPEPVCVETPAADGSAVADKTADSDSLSADPIHHSEIVILTSLPLLSLSASSAPSATSPSLKWGRFVVLPGRGMICESQTLRHPPSSWFVDETVVQDGALYLCSPVDPIFLLIPKLQAARGVGLPYKVTGDVSPVVVESTASAADDLQSPSIAPAGTFRDLPSIVEHQSALETGHILNEKSGSEHNGVSGWSHVLRLFVASEPAAAAAQAAVHRASLNAVCDTREIWDGEDKQVFYRLNDGKLTAWLQAKTLALARALRQLDRSVSTGSAKASTFVESSDSAQLTSTQYLDAALGFLSEYVDEDWMHRTAVACGVVEYRPAIVSALPPTQQTLDAMAGVKRTSSQMEEDDGGAAAAREDARRKLTHNVRHKQLAKAVTKNQGRLTSFFTAAPKK